MDETTVCSACGAKNRLKTSAGNLAPVCGRCKSPLPWVSTATDSSFRSELETGIPVLVDFWAEWCGPCRIVSPVLEELARDLAGRIKIVKLNVDQNPRSAQMFRVSSIPTLIIFSQGTPVDTIVGALPKDALLQRLHKHLT